MPDQSPSSTQPSDPIHDARRPAAGSHCTTRFYSNPGSAEGASAQELVNQAVAYQNGTGCGEDLERAVALLRRAADLGSAEAQFRLGLCLFTGAGAAQDVRAAAGLYETAARQGHIDAQVALAFCFRDGTGRDQDQAKADFWFTRARNWIQHPGQTDDTAVVDPVQEPATQARAPDQAAPAPGDDADSKAPRASKLTPSAVAAYARQAMRLRERADQGDTDSLRRLADRYRVGHGVEQDPEQPGKLYQRAAQEGDHQAQFNLAFLLRHGISVEKNTKQALLWLEQAADGGLAAAQCLIGDSYRTGDGVQVDLRTAVAWYTKAARLGDAKARYALFVLHRQGKFRQDSMEQALVYLYGAAIQGSVDAQWDLGGIYAAGEHGVEQDWTKAAAWYRRAADQGHAKAKHELALCFLDGKGAPRDSVQAVLLFREANFPESMRYLGDCYLAGNGVVQCFDRAVRHYERAARSGSAVAQHKLGLFHLRGTGTRPDWNKAVKLFKEAADQGLPAAQCSLAECYENGSGSRKKFFVAAELYKQAAEKGNHRAQYKLGMCHAKGRGVKCDERQAFDWWVKAARGGDRDAQFELGAVFMDGGLGVAKDTTYAIHWFKQAASQGHALASESLRWINNRSMGRSRSHHAGADWVDGRDRKRARLA